MPVGVGMRMGATTLEAEWYSVTSKLSVRYLVIDLLKALLKHQIFFLLLYFTLIIYFFYFISGWYILQDYTPILIKL